MFLVAGTAAGWMLYATRQAMQDIERLQARIDDERRKQEELRDKLRQAHSEAQASTLAQRKVKLELERAKAARRTAEMKLKNMVVANQALRGQLKDLRATSERRGDSARDRSARSSASVTSGQFGADTPVADQGGTSDNPGRSAKARSTAPVAGVSATTAPSPPASGPAVLPPPPTRGRGLLGGLATAAQEISKTAAPPASPAPTTPPIPPAAAKTTAPGALALRPPVPKRVVRKARPAGPVAPAAHPAAGGWAGNGATTIKPSASETRVVTSRLNIRASASLRAKKVATLTAGQKLVVTKTGAPKGWHRLVGPKGLAGFVKTTALRANSK